jgi:hypothetical protein
VKTSGWNPFGLLKFKRGEAMAKRIYASAVQLFGDSFSSEPGTFVDDVGYAASRMLAFAVGKVDRAGDQAFADTLYDMLPDAEDELGLHPLPTATIHQRKRAVAAGRRLPAGASRSALESALLTLLGPNYVGVHITKLSERVMWPAHLGDAPQNLQQPTVTRKLLRLLAPISIGLGAEMVIPYLPVEPTAPTGSLHTLLVGDKLTLEPEISGRAEVVTVDLLGTVVINAVTTPTFRAVIQNAHENLAYATTMPFPLWTSSQREIVVVVKNGTAVNSEQRRQVHELLERICTGVTTWVLVQESSPGSGTAGAFTLDDPILGLLDVTPLGQVTVP